jgi:hypothetical protein
MDQLDVLVHDYNRTDFSVLASHHVTKLFYIVQMLAIQHMMLLEYTGTSLIRAMTCQNYRS